MARAQKLDLYRLHRDQYVARRKPALVTIPPVPYLAIDGEGEPSGEAFQARIGGMYAMAFTIKMTRKFAGQQDYKVCHLEGLYWADDEEASFAELPREQWRWKLILRVPDFIEEGDLDKARAALHKKNKPPDFEEVRLETIDEGQCVQMLHVGPYADEPQTLEQMQQLAAANGLAFHGRHHEIYLSDPRRVPPERLRTILRMPVQPGEKA